MNASAAPTKAQDSIASRLSALSDISLICARDISRATGLGAMESVKYVADRRSYALFAQARVGLTPGGESDAYWDSATGIAKLAVRQVEATEPDNGTTEALFARALELRSELTSGLGSIPSGS